MASQLPSKKRGRGVASSKAIDAPVLSISSTHGHGLALKSTRSVTNAPLNSGTNPSNEELTSRLAESFGASWNAFNDIFLRKGRARSDEEIWITGTQRRLNSLLNRLHSQEASKISTSLPLFIAYHPALHVSVAHEGGLPGFSSSFLAQYTSCTYNAGAFSPPFDAKEVAPQSQSHASARRRTTFKYLSDLIHELECQGTFVVAMYYNDENELCFYKTAEFDLCSTEDSGGQTGAAAEATAQHNASRAAEKVQADARRAHSSYITSGSYEVYLSSLAAVLSGGVASSSPKLRSSLAIGLYGQQRLVQMARKVNHACRNVKRREKLGAIAYSAGVREVCTEFLVDIGLLSSDMSAYPAAHNEVPRNATAEDDEEHFYDKDGYNARLEYDAGVDVGLRELGILGLRPCAVDGGGIVDLVSLSQALPDGAFKTYCKNSMSRDQRTAKIKCVYDEHDGEEMRNRVYTMPNYDLDGKPTKGPPVLVRNSDRRGTLCRCPAALEAYRPQPRGARAPPPACLHGKILSTGETLQFLKALPCQPSPALTSEGGYIVDVTQSNSDEHVTRLDSDSKHMHVCILAHDAAGIARNELAIATLTPGLLSCSVCHDKRKHEMRSKMACPHAKFCAALIDANLEVEEMDSDLFRINEILSRTLIPTSGATTFNVEKGIYEHYSLSDESEKANEENIGVSPVNVEYSLSDIKPEGCQIGGRAHFPRDASEAMTFIEPIPSVQTPLHRTTGCVYCNQQNPRGWSSEEIDSDGRRHPHGRAYYLTHFVLASVLTRECSASHPECQIRFTGRADGFHRQSHETMVRHEVMLLYWHVTKNMHGPGAEAYGKMIAELHRLGGGVGDTGNTKRTLFMEADLLRRCILGFLSRQRRPRRGCPMCPGGLCKNITTDGKKLRNPVHLNAEGVSPEQPTPGAEEINCGTRRIADRMFWPGDQLREARAAASALSAAILGHELQKGEVPFTADRELVFSQVPHAYFGALNGMLGSWKDGNLEQNPPEDEIGEDDACETHGGLGDNEELEADESSSIESHSTCYGSSTIYGRSSSFSTSSSSSNSSSNSSSSSSSSGTNSTTNTTAPSLALVRAIAVQFRGMSNKQCEATQWLQRSCREVLAKFLTDYDVDGHFNRSIVDDLRGLGLRQSVASLIDNARVVVVGKPGFFKLHPIADSLLREMLRRAKEVRSDAMRTIPRRNLIPARDQPPYDPSTGVAYNFTEHGKRLYWWPRFKVKADRTCDCRKPDWMKIAPKGLSEGLMTFLCLHSGVVIGNHMLTSHEGCKDAGAALYSFHPAIDQLESVICDTPCMHATYMNTRCGADFGDLQWAGDRFHIKPHTCRAVYDPDEYARFDGINTSLVEQWHAVMDCLARTVKGSSLCNAMFLLQTLQDDHYLAMCAKKGVEPLNWN